MLFKPQNQISSIHHNKKIADILSQLCVSGFSYFLNENNVRRDAVDMDVLIRTFFQQHIRVDPDHVYPETIDYKHGGGYKGFMSGKKIVLPSKRFSEKIQFHLKWLMFYQPQFLFDPERTIVNPLGGVADFSLADPTHFYCGLDDVLNVLKYSIEDMYEIFSSPIEELPRLCKKRHDLYVIWYNKDLSPYPHPSLVVLYNSLEKTREAIKTWRDDHYIIHNPTVKTDTVEQPSVYDWQPDKKIWMKPEIIDTDTTNIFRAKVQDDQYLLFFPMNN